MAAVIGSARTLQQRWRELWPEQREAFLAVIADETTRLAELIADVLDTSRIEAGTFSYAFADVDLAELVRDAVAAAELGQDEVRLRAELPRRSRTSAATRVRLRQLVDNLIANAVKYSTGRRGARRGPRRRRPRRRGVRDPGPASAPEHRRNLREVRPRRGQPQAGHGARAVHRALDRRGPRRLARRSPPARRGRDVHPDACRGSYVGT